MTDGPPGGPPRRLTTPQLFSCLATFEQAAALIRRGLADAAHLSGEEPDEFLPLHDLAAGVERLCKGVLWCAHYVETGQPLSQKAMKREFGHDIVELADSVVARCFTPAYRASRPAAEQDYTFLTSDVLLRVLLATLADFGSGGRYFHLDVVAGAVDFGTRSYSDRLDDVATLVAERDAALDRARFTGTAEGHRTWHDGVQREIRASLERFTRALARLFTLGPLRDLNAYVTGNLSPFLFLQDYQLGRKDWRAKA